MATLVSKPRIDLALADARVSQNSIQFSPEAVKVGGGVDRAKLKKTIQELRSSHIEIGDISGTDYRKRYGSTMQLNGDQTPEIDRNRLRKASWMLGTNSFKYESVSKSAFGTLNQSMNVSHPKKAIEEIKNRVRGDSVDTKTGSQDEATIKGYFQTNSHTFHHHFGKAEPVDPRLAEEARKKLSDSNFNMGQNELQYKTMANSQFKPFIRVNNSTINDRKKNAIRNSITNFLDQKTGLFEKPIDTQKFGAIPVKNQGPDSRLSDIVNEIKSAHFELGRNGKNNFSYQTNKLYGSNQPEVLAQNKQLPWASRSSHFTVGSTPGTTMSCYKERYNAQVKSRLTRNIDCEQNKLRIQFSSIQLQANNEQPVRGVSQEKFQDVYNISRNLNQPLDKQTEANIKGSHWKTGEGSFKTCMSHYKKEHQTMSLNEARNSLPAKRKDDITLSHFSFHA